MAKRKKKESIDKEVVEDFMDMLKKAVKDTGRDLGNSVTRVEQYAQERLEVLAGCVGVDGFDEAVEAETQNVKIEAGLALVENADMADARLLGIISGGLEMGAKILSRALGAAAPA